jgi:hypothetical protein
MTAQLPEGKYEATITDQRFDETKTGKPQFILEIEVEAELVGDEPQPLDTPKRRTIYRCLEGKDDESTRKLLDWFRSTARHLGFDTAGRRLSDIDPDLAGARHYSFVGQTIVVKCRHTTYNGELHEQWDVHQPRTATPVNSEKMERLGALFTQIVDEREDDETVQSLSCMSQADVEREAAVAGDDDNPF